MYRASFTVFHILADTATSEVSSRFSTMEIHMTITTRPRICMVEINSLGQIIAYVVCMYTSWRYGGMGVLYCR